MPKPSDTSLKEYERLSQFFYAAVAFLKTRPGAPPDVCRDIPVAGEWKGRTSGGAFSEVLAGMREGVRDLVRMIDYYREESPGVSIAEVDAYFAEKSVPTYTEMRRKQWQALASVLRRGAIKSDDEFGLVNDVLADVSASSLTDTERERLGSLLGAYQRNGT